MSTNYELEIFEQVTLPGHGSAPDPRIGEIVFDIYGGETQPPVAVSTEERYVEKEPIGEAPVRQHLGPGFTHISIVGECTTVEAKQIDDLSNGERQYVRTARWSGYATVDTTDTESMGKYYRDQLVHKYTLELTEV